MDDQGITIIGLAHTTATVQLARVGTPVMGFLFTGVFTSSVISTCIYGPKYHKSVPTIQMGQRRNDKMKMYLVLLLMGR